MYEEFWNLKEKPFQNTPDPRYLYLSAQHEDALMKLSYCLTQGLGCGMLTGEFGCGKTLLARALLNELGQIRYACAFIINPFGLEPQELLRAILRGLSPQELPEKRSELLIDPLLEKLNYILINNVREGKENIVIIDEAHTIEDKRIFEQMRLILNFQLEDRFLLNLLILGQPELKDKIESNKPLDQRVIVRCQLGPLSQEDIEKYISHRLNIAGYKSDNPLFKPEAIRLIFEHSGGIPRRINTLCDLALMAGFAKKASSIDSDLIKSLIKEFGLA